MFITELLARAKRDEFPPSNHYVLFQLLLWGFVKYYEIRVNCVLNVSVKYIESEELTSDPNRFTTCN